MISWWCTTLEEPWSWTWIPYPGVWIASILPMLFFGRSVRNHSGETATRQKVLFVLGWVVFWIASDWPLGTLGAGYLASAHVTQFLLYTLGAAPLILLGTPEWMARRFLSKARLYRATVWLGRSLVASAVIYNVILLSTHAPGTVETLRASQFGSFAMDVVWLISGFILWLPVLSPLSEGRAKTAWAKMIYLFVTTSVIAVIPASYLTFTTTPIYAVYELAPRIGSMTAAADQQIAGIIMKLVTMPVIWGTIAVIWFRWANVEARTVG
ncbi:MAG: cytochrome c oxidase assembly protein [Actinomycetota bacterium]|nr:cytochrome c oxidase assembly protein [Actinomycetota bacterium]